MFVCDVRVALRRRLRELSCEAAASSHAAAAMRAFKLKTPSIDRVCILCCIFFVFCVAQRMVRESWALNQNRTSHHRSSSSRFEFATYSYILFSCVMQFDFVVVVFLNALYLQELNNKYVMEIINNK